MAKGGIAAAFIGAVLVSFALGYFVIPLLEPAPSGVIRQVQSVEANSLASIDSTTATWQTVPGMSLVITTSHPSRLRATFSTPTDITIPTSTSGRVMWNLTLAISGVGSRNGSIGYLTQAVLSDYMQLYESFSIIYLTASVPAGSYSVTVSWVSHSLATQTCNLYLSTPTFNYTRSLVVEELNL
jgi:hypothetical protein